jgi:hypothetical protein
MSVTSSPRYNDARRREEEADSRRTRLIIALICGAAIIANLFWLASMVKP